MAALALAPAPTEAEEELRIAQHGDADEFGLLYNRHRRYVRNFIWKLYSDDFDINDLMQNTFLLAFRARKQFRGESAFRSWVCSIATNCVHTYRRQEGRQKNVYVADLDPDRFQTATSSIDEYDIKEAHQQLPAPERLVAGMEIEGYTQDEISEKTRLSVRTVQRLSRRARKLLALHLKPELLSAM